ncbi:MAG: cupin domain-containing protein [Muribaculaceae bacterium]|nr:cupin domain-containing protein [Muribaculaceae bacterium]
MMDKQEFGTPPKHMGFLAKRLFGTEGEIKDGSIAYIEPGGGGPTEAHTHSHDHLFVVVKGEATIRLANDVVKVGENESYRVGGRIPHSVWNETAETVVMIGITVE